MNSASYASNVTVLFTDVEGSTRLWEQLAEKMPRALACHDALSRQVIEGNRGTVVKMTGDGVYAVFDDPLQAVVATVELQQALADPDATNGVGLRIRCGLHAGLVERRDNDYFGSPVNRAARIMSAAHGGQVLLSQAVVDCVRGILPTTVSLRDLGKVRLKDLSTPEHVYQVVHPQLRQDFPALRSLEATPNNLPQQVSSFIGRSHELAEVRRLLGKTRLLTLVGAGGLGKTRLSQYVAAEVMEGYPDGVWLVELAPLADERLVPQAVASVLGVKEVARQSIMESLARYVKDRTLLLILDNCEHLVAACADLANQLLQSGSDLKILASSREHLGLTGETTYPVSTLGVPDSHQATTLETLTTCESVRLFIARATAAQPAFRMSDQNAAAVADICRRLDGIPLAIELAAARVRALSVEKIALRLDKCFHLLTGGDRTKPSRQQTLRASIDWSYNLLTERERVVLRRLAVFAGGWTLEAAETVGGEDRPGATDMPELLGHLVDKCLVEFDIVGERYRLLETVRQYAEERLKEAGEEERSRTRHLAFVQAIVDKAHPKIRAPVHAAWISQLHLERENFLAAHAWCDRAAGGAALGLGLVYPISTYWINRGALDLGYRVTVEALARVGAEERTLIRCLALSTAGMLGQWMGRSQEAQQFLKESLSIAREIGDEARVADRLRMLGEIAHDQGYLAEALKYYEESLAIARDLGDKWSLAPALSALGELQRATGDFQAAQESYEQSLALYREQGDLSGIAGLLLNLAMTSISRGDKRRVRAILLEAFAIIEEMGDKPAGRTIIEVCAGLAALDGDWKHAARFFGAADAQLAPMGRSREPADRAFLTAVIVKAREAMDEAAFVSAEGAGRALSFETAMAEARLWLERLETCGLNPQGQSAAMR